MTPVQRIRVPAGFALAVLFFYLARPTPSSLLAGTAVALLGAALRVWAAGHLQKWRALARSGPYRYTRNPLYLGSFAAGLGLCGAAAEPKLLIIFLVFFALLYVPVMKKEEAELREAYGEEFEAYRRQVPLFFPQLRAAFPQEGPERNFQWRRVISNREHRSLAGLTLIILLLLAKMAWWS